MKVLDLKYRWGSCSQDGTLNFHWKTILAPMTVVDYIVVHEMAHLIEHNHTPEFWDLVGMVLSDYEKRKEWLERNGKYLDIKFQRAPHPPPSTRTITATPHQHLR